MDKNREVASLLTELGAALSGIEQAADGVEMDLRLDLADLVMRGLAHHGWTQKQLADATGIAEARISGIIHANLNVTLRTVADLMHALSLRPHIVAAHTTSVPGPAAWQSLITTTDGDYSGEAKIEETYEPFRFERSGNTAEHSVAIRLQD